MLQVKTNLSEKELSYKWKKDGKVISSETNPSAASSLFYIKTTQPSDRGIYSCEVSNETGSEESESTILELGKLLQN